MSKPIRQQIADLEAKRDEIEIKLVALRVQADAEVNYEHIVAGAVIEFDYGKGEGVRTVTGTVVAVKPADPTQPKSAPQIKAAFGEGFDAQFATIYFTKVKKVVSTPVVTEEAAA